jgi:biopolymer transport protein ExbB
MGELGMLYKFILVGFLTSGSFAMWLILITGFVIIGLLIERGWYLYVKCGSNTNSFMTGLSKYLKAGDYEKASKYASSLMTPLAKATAAILQNRGKSSKIVQKSVDEVFLTETPKISRNINLLNILANIATLLGLLGTIYGLMMAFDAIANVPAAQRAQALASGISCAMSTTLFGLLVAIPTLVIQGIYAQRSDKVVEEMDEKTTKLINLIEE